jgi:hypothetical protein
MTVTTAAHARRRWSGEGSTPASSAAAVARLGPLHGAGRPILALIRWPAPERRRHACVYRHATLQPEVLNDSVMKKCGQRVAA